MKSIKVELNAIEVNMSTLEQTCHGCPTVYEFKDLEGESFYFRLRHGGWYLRNRCHDIIVASGGTDDGADGICDWEDVKRYCLTERLLLIEK